MEQTTDIYKDCYIEIINQGTFNAYFTVDYVHNTANYSFKSKILKSGMLDKIMLCAGGTNVHVVVYLINSTTNISTILYDNSFNTVSMLKLLLTGTELSPSYADITKLPSPNDKTEFYSYYVSILNTADYISKLTVKYIINNKKFVSDTDKILTNHTGLIYLPTVATNIEVYIQIRDTTTSWRSIYSNTLASPTILKLSLSGTILSPIYTDISSQLSTGSLPTLSENIVSVINNGDFISQFYVIYNLPDTINNITTNNFSKGETKLIHIPPEATNIDFGINLMYSDNSWINIYKDFFKNSINLKLQLTGTLSVPIVSDIGDNTPPDVGNTIPSIPPTLSLTKAPDKPIVIPNQEVLFTLIISHKNGDVAEYVTLQDTIPSEATFVANSLTINNNVLTENSFPESGIDLGDMNFGDSHTITYKIKFNSIPNPNIVKCNPMLTYDYNDSDGTLKEGTLTGITVPLIVAQNNCCNHCMCNCADQDDPYLDYI